MSKLFFNTEYQLMSSISDCMKLVDYYNRDDRSDKTLLDKNEMENPEDMMSYYFYRKGSCGGFGLNGDRSYEDIMEDFQKYKPNYVWRSIITFKKEDAAEFGLHTKKDFAALTRKVVIKMANEKNIPLKDVCYAGFYHINTDNPHVHFYFFDRRDPLNHTLFSKESIKHIKATIAREVIDRTILLKDKEDSSRKLLLDARNMLNDDLVIKKLEEHISNKAELSKDFIHPKYKLNRDFFKQLLYLDSILPLSGRLSYESTALDEYRNDIDKLIDTMLEQKGLNEDFKTFKAQLYQVYESNIDLYGDGENQNKYIENQMKRIRSSLGNAILKMIKAFREQKACDKDFQFSDYLSKSDINKMNRQLIKPYGHDLMRYSICSLCHEVSLMKQMTRIRQREQQKMLQQVRQENKEKEEVEYAT